AFVDTYREAQRARVAKLDDIAHGLIETRMAARKKFKATGDAKDRVIGAHTPVMTIWRTAADLRYFDLALDPSDRKYGSVWGQDPYQSNYGNVGFARFCSPESWLSTWSGLSSQAEMAKTSPAVEQPSILIAYTGDNTVYPSDSTAIFEAIASADKVQHKIRGDHHGHALAEGEEPGRIEAGKILTDWLASRFPKE
ncbi:MAG: alpha/beta hydrolase, partial [Rhodospirillaceae bacterium]|nr:alpha/beta hydrolase [Rhodospirillaceae bacterium]